MLSGFVLAGGKSRRMGTDKALLSFGKRTMVEHVAGELAAVADPVCLVGDPARYSHFGLAVIEDKIADRGPLSGCEAALLSSAASEWNLIVACDLPNANHMLFQRLAAAIQTAASEVDCIVPRHDQESGGKIEPLCAIYRRRCGSIASLALAKGTRRVVDWVGMLQAEFWPVENLASFQNVNTPSDWERFLNER